MEINNIKFNKKYGQNFIFDTNLLNAIISDANLKKDDEVLEIGTGAGTLTKIIANNCKKVVSYEIDENLKEIIFENLKEINNAKIIFKDALKEDIKNIENNFENNYSIIANLPYYITTPLILKFIQETERVNTITIMIQKEVAERLVASCNSKDYSSITVLLNFYGDVKILRNVNRKMFIPMPSVDSAIVQIELKKKYECDEKMFSNIVRASFAMRRKTIYNNLLKFLNLSKEKILKMLETCKIQPQQRAESLTIQNYVDLTKSYFDIISHKSKF